VSKTLLRVFATVGAVLISSTAVAQFAPLTDDHYGGRLTDTGFGGVVTPNGGYRASIPFDLPSTRDGTPIPFELVSTGPQAGAAGAGWDIPLSFIRVDDSYVHRKTLTSEGSGALQPNEQVVLSLGGRTTQLVPTQSGWVPRSNAPMLSAQHSSPTADWTVLDGLGHTYTFRQPSGHENLGLWLLYRVDGPGGQIMQLTYGVADVLVSGGQSAVSIDLDSIDYNFSPTLPCAKNEILLTYNSDTAPISLSVLEFTVIARLHTLATVQCKAAVTARHSLLCEPTNSHTRLMPIRVWTA
jgi:hypothetical protein